LPKYHKLHKFYSATKTEHHKPRVQLVRSKIMQLLLHLRESAVAADIL